jgi:nucleotide-sensitive chloride channel 1A
VRHHQVGHIRPLCAALCLSSRSPVPRSVILACPDDSKSVRYTYHQIAMHALSRDLESFPQPCVYCQLDEEPDEEDNVAEARFVPRDASHGTFASVRAPWSHAALLTARAVAAVEQIYNAFCECAALNPDPEQEGGETQRAAAMDNRSLCPFLTHMYALR